MLKCHSGWIYNLDLVTSYRLYMNVYSVVNNYRCWLLYMNPENRKEMMRLGDVSQLSFHPTFHFVYRTTETSMCVEEAAVC